MAINNSYPIANPAIGDILIGSKNLGEDGMITKSFTVGDILSLGNGEVGPTGPQGPIGPAGLVWLGEWVPDSTYFPGDAVSIEGSSYICTVEVDGSNEFPYDDPANWDLLAEKGDIGPEGPQLPQVAYSMKVNNTAVTAVPVVTNYRAAGIQTLVDDPIFSDDQTPTGTVNKFYDWQRMGNLVTVTIWVEYATWEVETGEWIRFNLPSDMPACAVPTGFTGSSRVIYTGVANASTTDSSITQTTGAQTLSLMRRNGSSEPDGFHFLIPYTIDALNPFKVFRMTLQYFTA
jgi:hypothetical protein